MQVVVDQRTSGCVNARACVHAACLTIAQHFAWVRRYGVPILPSKMQPALNQNLPTQMQVCIYTRTYTPWETANLQAGAQVPHGMRAASWNHHSLVLVLLKVPQRDTCLRHLRALRIG